MPRKAAPVAPVDDLDATLARVALADVRPHPRNYQDHPEAEIQHLMQSLTTHGVYRNVVIARDGTLLPGHGVVEAARRLGYTHLTMCRKDYDPHEPRALQLLVGDNEIAREVLKNDEALVALLEALSQDDPLALLGTGFDEATRAAWVYETLGKAGDSTLDPFLGSGPSLLAAEQCGRTVYGCELSTEYVAIVLERWHQLTGETPQRLT